MREGTVRLGQYELIRRIGAGGMAEVFLAKTRGLAGFSRTVAIKTIITHGAQRDAIRMFLDEARVAARLLHANIVQTLDLGFEEETLFIVMEYVPGPPLSKLIEEQRRRGEFCPAHVVAHIGARVAEALDFAHRAQTSEGPMRLVHRDISPQNILVTRAGTVKLTDFGIARASIQMHQTEAGQVRGKASYMAPEQVRARPLDGRTDLFGLAASLYEMLTHLRVFARRTEVESMRAIVSEPAPPLSSLRADVPANLCRVIERGLEKRPEDRYPDCRAFARALRETYEARGESSTEAELGHLVGTLFGEEQFDEDSLAEAWHPTVALVDGRLVLPKPRQIEVPDELASLLGQPRPTEIGPIGGLVPPQTPSAPPPMVLNPLSAYAPRPRAPRPKGPETTLVRARPARRFPPQAATEALPLPPAAPERPSDAPRDTHSLDLQPAARSERFLLPIGLGNRFLVTGSVFMTFSAGIAAGAVFFTEPATTEPLPARPLPLEVAAPSPPETPPPEPLRGVEPPVRPAEAVEAAAPSQPSAIRRPVRHRRRRAAPPAPVTPIAADQPTISTVIELSRRAPPGPNKRRLEQLASELLSGKSLSAADLELIREARRSLE